jgi:hypothetical protein
MRRLRSGMNNNSGLESFDQSKNAGAISNVQFMMIESREILNETLLVPSGIPLRAEEGLPLVVINSMDYKSIIVEKFGHFRSD